MIRDPIDSFRHAIASAGMEPPADIHGDGKIYRFSPTGKRRDDAAWYVMHLDGTPAGAFGNWRDGLAQCWCSKSEREMTPAERTALARRVEAVKRQRDAEQHQRHADAAATAAIRWGAAMPAMVHPYLTTKGVRAHGVRVDGDSLLIPMRDSSGNLHSLQTIAPDGTKRFMPGGRVTGCYYSVGRPSGRIVIAEGVATAHTIFEATGIATAAAFSASNLMPVARALRGRFPCADLLIAADDDAATAGNPGRACAEQAALAVGGVVVLPQHQARDPARSCDFNDLAALPGLGAVRACFAEAGALP
ncbi:toprim domain-containing protein [Variovorax sp. RTB1]|uniref:toprim domain-containing protein n=1 Tax=Variovorax sp. RTB1 TaxID=3048631 RepID=UPI002B239F19|nr:toprim domain-containing protein [Variovorax sp. RTB1]MEB0112784.1 toprim domain-containing protein [Variovorax sp. RTB1]